MLLLQEVIKFLEIQKKRELKSIFTYGIFQKRFAYLADIFGHLNEPNRKLQGMDSNIIVQRDKIYCCIYCKAGIVEREKTEWSQCCGNFNVT